MNSIEQTKTNSSSNLKKQITYIDRLTAWLAIPLLAAATFVYFIPAMPSWAKGFNLVFQILFVSHTILSIYRFRLPRFNGSNKTIQVYSGYGILLTVILNMILYGQEPYATLVFWANWLFVAVHIVISVRFWLNRRKGKQP